MKLICGDSLSELKRLDDESVHCCVISPPYWGLRDYGVEGQMGLEDTPNTYICKMVELFREVARVLRNDGTLWLNIGDSYAVSGQGGDGSFHTSRPGWWHSKSKRLRRGNGRWGGGNMSAPGLKPKDLVGIPWRLAFALQADGWYLRSDIIWAKSNPMPESVKDRPTKSHEYIFLLSKSPKYYYDADAIKEPVSGTAHSRGHGLNPKALKKPAGWQEGKGAHDKIPKGRYRSKQNPSFSSAVRNLVDTRNKRSVWKISTEPFAEAHFATFPKKLVLPCILAGSPKGGIVLDPFAGSGTTGIVAARQGRNFIGIELNPEYVEIARARIQKETSQQRLFS